MSKLFLGAGHGGKDPGAIAYGTSEYNECEKIARRAVKSLRDDGVDAVLVPLGLTLKQRIAWVNQNTSSVDYLIEIHMNAASPQATGAEAFFYDGSEYSKNLCASFLQTYCNNINLKNRGVKPDTATRFGRLGIIRDTTPIALLLELGFITNEHDLKQVRRDGQEALESACRGIMGVEEKQPEISEWGKPAVDKAIKKNIAVYWDKPRTIIADSTAEHMFYNLGLKKQVTGNGVTKEEFIVILDRLRKKEDGEKSLLD